jgi:hypothetical protein
MRSTPNETAAPADRRPAAPAPTAGAQPGGLLAEAVAQCLADAEFTPALRSIYARADAAVARRGFACRACGACCRFEGTGRRLFLSTGELALLASAPAPAGPRGLGCPYQLGARCMARERRGLGCRVFFCADDAAEWSHRTYEKWHAEIRALHDRRGVPYRYVELTAALAEPA